MPLTVRVGACALLLVVAIAATAGTLTTRYGGGRLSLRAHSVSLPLVLERVSREFCLSFEIADDVAPLPADWTIDDLPAEQALLEITRPYNTALFRQARSTGPDCFRLSVLPAGTSGSSNPTSTATPRIAAKEALRLAGLVQDGQDLAVSRRAIRDLAALPPPHAVRGLELAMGVQIPQLRSEVIRELGRVYDDAPPIVLGQTLLGDSDVGVRLAAVEALTQLSSDIAQLFLRQALNDRDERVRQEAAKALGARAKP
jgi:hypothetical protein